MNRHPDSPTAIQLLKAVESSLLEQLAGKTAGAEGFQLRVILHTLATVRRELEQTDRLHEAESGLQKLLAGTSSADGEGDCSERQKLCLRLRSGLIAPDDSRLLRWLRQDAMARIAIDNPNYSTFLHLNRNGE